MQRYRNYPNHKPSEHSSADDVIAAMPKKEQKYPAWLNKIPGFERFMMLSRRKKLLIAAGIAFAVFIIVTLFTTIFFASSLGSKEAIMNRNKTGVTLVDVNDKVFYEFYNAHSGTYVPLSEISKTTQEAAIASEDKSFYSHSGFSPIGIISAVWQNIKPGGIDSGGSTITQQLVKNALLTKERSYLRKYQEIVLSVEIERRYSKDEILEMYLNSVYFGEGAFGIENAASTYYGKTAKDLTTAEASTLVGLLPAPSAYSPVSGDPKKTEVRQDYVLDRMVDEEYITKAKREVADKKKLVYSEQADSQYQAPHFALMVLEELEARYEDQGGEEFVARSGFKVKTTLNSDWQKKAEEAVVAQVAALSGSNVTNGGAVVIDPATGEIRALVGSVDWSNSDFGKLNITTADRQPGSSFKPFVYATGIETGDLTAATILHDKPTDFGGGYSPENYDLGYRGNVTVRNSLANSLNVTAVEAIQITGVDPVIDQTRKLGLTTLSDEVNYGLSLALGSGEAKLTEMTNAYAVMANAGRRNDITTHTSIADKENNEIYKYKPKNERAISDETSYIMSSIMSDDAARAGTFGTSLTVDRPAAVKTGTTENYRDAWTIGFTPSIAVGTWVGNNNGSSMSNVSGAVGAAPIWRSIMLNVSAGTVPEQFSVPAGIAIRDICPSNGGIATQSGENTIKEYFRAGILPDNFCNATKKEEPKKDKPKKEEPVEEEEEVEEPIDPEEPVDPEEPIDPVDPPIDPPVDP
jgi:1A family penicillin-binding protein